MKTKITAIIIIILSLARPFSQAEVNYKHPFEYQLDESYEIGKSPVISLNAKDANINVIGSDREDVRIRVDYAIRVKKERMLENFRFSVESTLNESGIEFEQKRRIGVRSFANTKIRHTIVLEVPRNSWISIKEDDGSVSIDNIAGGVEVSIDDGTVRFDNCSGDVKIVHDDSKVIGKNNTFDSLVVSKK